MSNDRAYRFNGYLLLPEQRQLLADGQAVKLGSRAFDMLVALVERRERTVGKHELMDLVWPHLVVEENNLQVQVLALRKLLGHPAIATIPGRGYRFTLPLSSPGMAATANDPVHAASQAPDARTLPPATPALIGRSSELAAVASLLAAHPVVTITGAGGIGKTRLAQAVSAASGPQHAQGVWWVELAAIAEPSLVGSALAKAMGLDLGGARDATAAVLAALRGRAAWVVFDNAEHLLDAVAALVVAIRGAARDVHVLVTSQEVLHCAEEQVYRLGPLALPAAGTQGAADDDGALALFAARAQAADPRFVLGPGNRAAAAEICRRLDGIPLAIELAAARVPLLGVEGIRQRLDERFHLLTGGAREALRRHLTLRAALDWSHALLAEGERRVLRRLAVFVGSFGLQSAQELAADAAIDGWDVLDHLGGLVDKSMVVAEGEPMPRYRLLETTRLYAMERLAEAREIDALLLAHAEHFCTLVERADADMKDKGEGAAALARIDAERDEVLHALGWCERSPEPKAATIGLRMAAGLRYYWPSRGLTSLGLDHTLSILERATDEPVQPLRSQALASAANLASILGQSAQVRALAEEALMLSRAAGDEAALRNASLQLAWQYLEDGEHARAEPLLHDVLQRARAAAHARDEGRALNGLARLAAERGQNAEARALLETLVASRRRAGQNHDLCIALLNSADAACQAGDHESARAALLEAMPCAQKTGSMQLALLICRFAPTLLAARHQLETAVALLTFMRLPPQCMALASRPCDDEAAAATLAAARALLAPEAHALAEAEGAAMSQAEALERIAAELSRRGPEQPCAPGPTCPQPPGAQAPSN